MSDLISPELLSLSCLDAGHWWVVGDHKYHTTFKNGASSYYINRTSYEDLFCEFTNRYSVFNRINSDIRKTVLARLMDSDFHNQVIQGNISVVDDLLHLTKTSNKTGNDIYHLSMLSKYATLINPKAFRMLDRNAIWSLRALSNKNGVKPVATKLKVDYSYFHEAFENVKETFLSTQFEDVVSKHHEYFFQYFSSNPIDNESYVNRVIDKYLWHYCNVNKK